MIKPHSTVLTTTISVLTVGILAIGTLISGAKPVAAMVRQTSQPPIIVWTKFNSQNPQNSQDRWLAAFLAEYAAKTGNKATNVFQPFDQIDSKLNIAVQSGGEVPDLSYVDSQNIPFFYKNGDLVDLTDYVKNAPWFKDMNPNAIADCTAPDGKIYCVPTSGSAVTVYYWKDYFPNGFPTIAQDLLAMAKNFKAANPQKYIVTLKGSEQISFQETWFPLIMSAGGTIADPKTGAATWANDKTAAVVQWARDLFAGQYAPQVDLATGFDDETPFTKADAAAFLAGSWSYVYLNPLIAPDGTKFDKGSASVQTAFDAGKLGFSTPLTWKGGQPVSMLSDTAYGIPIGAKNPDAAKAFIDYAMQTQQNADYAAAYGAIPTLISSLADPRLNTGYWKVIAENQTKYGVIHPYLVDYDKGITALVDAINKLMVDPKADIMQTLQAAQDNYNNGLK